MAKRVVCLGAYANGNLGDMYQADAIAELIREVRPDVEVTSVSPSRRATDYPAEHHVKGPVDGCSGDYINGFDALFVGGGGLFSAPHAPLQDPAWSEQLTLPVFALSVGAAGKTPEDSRAFIEKCRRFSVRDEYCLAAVKDIRPDAEIVMDPILLNEAAKAPYPPGERKGVLWVPGKIVEGTRRYWAEVGTKLIQSADRVISFNPVTDHGSGFDEAFDHVEYLETIEPFLQAAADARYTLSERYHGCIFALARGIPTLGIATRSMVVTSKIRELYRRIGHPDAVVEDLTAHTRQSLRALADTIDLAAVRGYLAGEHERLGTFLAECLA